jgi:hypothetical protein
VFCCPVSMLSDELSEGAENVDRGRFGRSRLLFCQAVEVSLMRISGSYVLPFRNGCPGEQVMP